MYSLTFCPPTELNNGYEGFILEEKLHKASGKICVFSNEKSKSPSLDSQRTPFPLEKRETTDESFACEYDST